MAFNAKVFRTTTSAYLVPSARGDVSRQCTDDADAVEQVVAHPRGGGGSNRPSWRCPLRMRGHYHGGRAVSPPLKRFYTRRTAAAQPLRELGCVLQAAAPENGAPMLEAPGITVTLLICVPWLPWSDVPFGDGPQTMSVRELVLGTGAGAQWTGWGLIAPLRQASLQGAALAGAGSASRSRRPTRCSDSSPVCSRPCAHRQSAPALPDRPHGITRRADQERRRQRVPGGRPSIDIHRQIRPARARRRPSAGRKAPAAQTRTSHLAKPASGTACPHHLRRW